MTADPEYNSQLVNAEAEKLRELEKSLSDGDKERIRADAKKLQEHQDQEQNIEVLPTLTRDDIPPEIERVHVDIKTTPPPQDNKATRRAQHNPCTPLYVVNQPTNGVGYSSCVFDVSSQKREGESRPIALPERLRQKLPLFAHCLTQVATEDHSAEELAELLNLRTGGISSSFDIVQSYSDLSRFTEQVVVSSSALTKNVHHMMSLLEEIVFSPKFSDYERLKTLVTSYAQDFAASLQDNGTSFASSHASSHLLPSRLAMERASGIEQANFLNSLVSSLAPQEAADASKSEDVSRDVIARLAKDFEEIAQLLRAEHAGVDRWKFTGDGNAMAELMKTSPSTTRAGASAQASASNASEGFAFSPALKPTRTFFQYPISSNYVAATIPTVANEHEDFAKLLVLGQLMQFVYLLPEVREKGGAYGAYAGQSGGVFSLTSFRDGKCRTTLSKFAEAIDKASKGEFSELDVSQALLSTFSRLDTPISPYAKGNALFLSGITDEMRQRTREKLLAVKRDDLIEVTQKYLKKHTSTLTGQKTPVVDAQKAAADPLSRPSHICVVGPETANPEEKPLPESEWVYKSEQ